MVAQRPNARHADTGQGHRHQKVFEHSTRHVGSCRCMHWGVGTAEFTHTLKRIRQIFIHNQVVKVGEVELSKANVCELRWWNYSYVVLGVALPCLVTPKGEATNSLNSQTQITLQLQCTPGSDVLTSFVLDRKKIQTFTVDHSSRFISTYLSMYLEVSRHSILWSKVFSVILAQLSLISLVLSHFNLNYPWVQTFLGKLSNG